MTPGIQLTDLSCHWHKGQISDDIGKPTRQRLGKLV